jgi:hypothetical protein
LQNYDVTIKAHPKDYYKLPYVISSLKHLKPRFENIYIVSPDGYKPDSIFQDRIITVKDDEVKPFIDKTRFKHRYNWSWVNMLSLTQEFTKNDLYLDIQADNFFLNDLELFSEDGRPRLFKTRANPNNNTVWSGYFEFSKKMFGIDKITLGSSYIIEFMMYDKNKLKSLYEPYDKKIMIEKSYKEVSDRSYPADQEIYGNLIEGRFPGSYEIVGPIETYLGGDDLQDNDINRVLDYISSIKSQHPAAIACSHHTYWMPEWN